MTSLNFRVAGWRRTLHWLIAVGLITSSIVLYVTVFWLPYRNLSLEQCPSSCVYNSDCAVPGCPSVTECIKSTCQIGGGHQQFFTAAGLAFIGLIGLLWLLFAMLQTRLCIRIDEKGIVYQRLFWHLDIPWDSLLGISYHGVNTRFGREATVYSITSDVGLFSFLVMGLPENTSTREIELGSVFYMQLSEQEFEQMSEMIRQYSSETPSAENEW